MRQGLGVICIAFIAAIASIVVIKAGAFVFNTQPAESGFMIPVLVFGGTLLCVGMTKLTEKP